MRLQHELCVCTGLFDEYAGLLNLPFLQSLRCGSMDKRQLQVEVSNWINEFDKKNSTDSVTRLKVEGLIFEASYKFIVNLSSYKASSWQTKTSDQRASCRTISRRKTDI